MESSGENSNFSESNFPRRFDHSIPAPPSEAAEGFKIIRGNGVSATRKISNFTRAVPFPPSSRGVLHVVAETGLKVRARQRLAAKVLARLFEKIRGNQ